MDFRLNEEQLEFQQHCRRFAREVIRPIADKYDREQAVPWEAIKAAREWNLHGLDTVTKIGTDPEGLFGVIYAEELHWGCAGIALAISASSLAAAGIAASGTPEQIGRWLPECFGEGDEIKLGAYAVTEAGAGSDVKSLRTTAMRDGDEWVLNGTKVFISNGGIADVNVVVATVDPDLGHRGQASFIVPKGAPGLSQGKKEDKIGIRASQTAELVFEDCRIPLENLLGGLEKLERKLERARSGHSGGASNALATFEITRPMVGASALGIAQAAYEWTLEHLEERADEHGPLLEQQHVQQVLADVATEIEASRMLVWRAAWMGRNGIPMTGGQGSMSKLKAGDVAMWVTTTLMDLVGPYAQTTECPLEKLFRDAKIYQLFEGTAQVQRLVISRMQRKEYRERVASEAEHVLEQAPGTASGSSVGDAESEKEPAAA
ncbi:MAG: acyl-CoA dehydrogenase family protein [Actinomycetota bacterium]|nr:acyl-CoA dehydrogenase family protein [Actinomycetota bacterium]MDQ3719888.1 acyl-CoA dehydrogenase family protein [Actinomycetota bacterium]